MSNELMQVNSFFAPQDPAAFAAAEAVKVRIQSAYIMAYQRPRDEEMARRKILDACRRPGFAADAEYSKPVAGGKVTGLSVRFAEVAMREWRNVLSDTAVVYEDEKIRRIKVTVTDLETNAAYSQDIQISKTVERKKNNGREVVGERKNTSGDRVYIVLATDEELMNKESSTISKAIRSMVLRLLPSDIKEEATSTIRATVSGKSGNDPKTGARKVLDAFATVGIYPDEIKRYLKHSTNRMSPAEIEDLRKIFVSIRDGEATWESFARSPEEEKAEEQNKQTVDIEPESSAEAAPISDAEAAEIQAQEMAEAESGGPDF